MTRDAASGPIKKRRRYELERALLGSKLLVLTRATLEPTLRTPALVVCGTDAATATPAREAEYDEAQAVTLLHVTLRERTEQEIRRMLR